MEKAIKAIPPAIRVTDPHNDQSRPVTASPTQSPSKNAPMSAPLFDTNGIKDDLSSIKGASNLPPSQTNTTDPNQEPPRPLLPHINSASTSSQQSLVDPLSKHIIDRMNTSGSLPSDRQKSSGTSDRLGVHAPSDSASAGKSSSDAVRSDSQLASSATRERRKSPSFFGRLMGTKKKDVPRTMPAPNEDQLDDRPEGADAQLFAESYDKISFSPRYPQPPSYIKVHAQGKKKKEFDRLFLAQELQDREKRPNQLGRTTTTSSMARLKRVRTNEESSATWALEFSHDGRFVAAAGQEKLVRVWSTLSSADDRKEPAKKASADSAADEAHAHLQAPVFSEKPIRVFEGHTGPILDLSWSKNNFLLSSSMDKTVRLWHVSRDECLCTFRHTDFVTSIQFHPEDDRFFLAGSLDSKLRLWSIPDKSVAFWNQASEMITAVCFTPDGKTAIAGCLTGICLFYETEGLKYQTQMHVRSAHGKNSKGSKITGIQSTTLPPSDHSGDVKLLISSNDSRIRLYNYRDKSLEMKFKGNENSSSQIHARFSEDARYIVCGSEDKRVFIWSLTNVDIDQKEKRPVEIFEAHSAATTVCALAPARTRQLLGGSQDPLFDLCNPPPVTLVCKADVESLNSGKAPDDASSIQQTPSAAETPFKKPQESPAYVARSNHPNGHIIVTSDATGCIRVFRQDCAYDKRMQWEPSSFSRKFSSVRRHSSMASSSRSLSRQDSSTSQSRDRILSWRQSIHSTTSTDAVNGAKRSPVLGAFGRGSPARSNSPKKLAQDVRSHRTNIMGPSFAPSRNSTPPSTGKSSFDTAPNGSPRRPSSSRGNGPTMLPPPLPPHVEVDGSPEEDARGRKNGETSLEGQTQAGQLQHPGTGARTSSSNSNTYWERDAWREEVMGQYKDSKARQDENGNALAPPPLSRGTSEISELTDEQSGRD